MAICKRLNISLFPNSHLTNPIEVSVTRSYVCEPQAQYAGKVDRVIHEQAVGRSKLVTRAQVFRVNFMERNRKPQQFSNVHVRASRYGGAGCFLVASVATYREVGDTAGNPAAFRESDLSLKVAP
jgi:hypothetical protein